jgi:hypothetical protein
VMYSWQPSVNGCPPARRGAPRRESGT